MLADGIINATESHKNLWIGSFSFKIFLSIIMFKTLVVTNSEPNPQTRALMPKILGKNQMDKIKSIAPST